MDFRNGAHVDDVSGYPRCTLTAEGGGVIVRVGTDPFTRLWHPHTAGATIEHCGDEVTVVMVAWEAPWKRAAVLVVDRDHRVLLPMSRRAAERIMLGMERAGVKTRLSRARHSGQVVALLRERQRECRHRGDSSFRQRG